MKQAGDGLQSSEPAQRGMGRSEPADEPEARPSLLSSWRYALRTANPPRGAVDPVTKWLVITRAALQPMTITSAAIAGLIAVHKPGFDPWRSPSPLWG
ncbi:MAG TPA: hypothetical protein VEQ37_13045 [Actinomycetota bacterium]|nr:hypothetical protein [Actinomycetota bacterium]